LFKVIQYLSIDY